MNPDLLAVEMLPSFPKENFICIYGDDKFSAQSRGQDWANGLVEEVYENGNRTPVFFGWV